MKDKEFLAMCRSMDPSKEVDRQKNLEAIRANLLQEKEQTAMKNKRFKWPAAVAAAVIATLMLSMLVYAAPIVWRYFDTPVVQGEEFARFYMAEFELPDGTTSIASGLYIDREAKEAAGGGAVIVEVDGEEWVLRDELHLDCIIEGIAIMQQESTLLPGFLPQGFAFSRLTFPVNPHVHQYIGGTTSPAASSATVYYVNGDDVITLRINYLGCWGREMGLSVSRDLGQRSVSINGHEAVLINGSLSDAELERLEGVVLYDWPQRVVMSPGVAVTTDSPMLVMTVDGVMYTFFSSSENVTLYDLARMAESMG